MKILPYPRQKPGSLLKSWIENDSSCLVINLPPVLHLEVERLYRSYSSSKTTYLRQQSTYCNFLSDCRLCYSYNIRSLLVHLIPGYILIAKYITIIQSPISLEMICLHMITIITRSLTNCLTKCLGGFTDGGMFALLHEEDQIWQKTGTICDQIPAGDLKS